MSKDYKITSLIDWQNCVALPLFLHSGIPDDLDNSVDPVSRSLEIPRLPDRASDLAEDRRLEQLETFCKQQLHYFYVKETARRNLIHFQALSRPFQSGRVRSTTCLVLPGKAITFR